MIRRSRTIRERDNRRMNHNHTTPQTGPKQDDYGQVTRTRRLGVSPEHGRTVWRTRLFARIAQARRGCQSFPSGCFAPPLPLNQGQTAHRSRTKRAEDNSGDLVTSCDLAVLVYPVVLLSESQGYGMYEQTRRIRALKVTGLDVYIRVG